MSEDVGVAGTVHVSAEAGPEAQAVLWEVGSVLKDLHRGELPEVSLESDLAGDLGLDSLAVVELYDRLERTFAVVLPVESLATATTPGDWLRVVLEARTTAPATGTEDLHAQPLTPRTSGEAWPREAETITEAFAWHVEHHPDVTTIRLLTSGPGHVEELSYRTLARQAAAAAGGLLAEGLDHGDRVALMLPSGREYFIAFLGTLLAGGVPVPIYPPARPSELEDHLGRQARLLDNAGAGLLVTVPEARVAARLLRSHVPSLGSIQTVDTLTDAGRGAHHLPAVAADDVALIQYTSGSTGDPRGVVLTHAQILANVHSMGEAVDVDTDDVFVSWLPLYHDMGLIGAWHASLLFGFPLVLLSPLEFLARPASWLETISRYAGTISAAPNFAYQSCVDRIGDTELAGLDLTSWRVAINGSEPVSASTLEQFVDRFGACGFRREAMCPAYGLAEVGVGLTSTPPGRGPRIDTVVLASLEGSGRAEPAAPGRAGSIPVVGCGVPFPGYELRVADRRGKPLPERREGMVSCRGPSAAGGYFANDAASTALWHEGWLETGDLGYLSEGELFLTGRAKDLVIRGGRNIHPEELELALGELDGVRRGGVAVVAGNDPQHATERLVVVAECDLHAPSARAALKAEITRRAVDLLGAPPDDVVLAPIGAIERTSSGKVRRAATRQALEDGTLGARRAPVVLQFARFVWSGFGLTLRRLGTAVVDLAFAVYAWALVLLIGVPLWGVVQLPVPRRVRWALTRAAGASLSALTGIHVAVDGVFPPPERPAVIVANHASFVDALVILLASPAPLTFVTSTELGSHWFVGRFLRRLGCVFVHRGDAGQSTDEVAHMARLVGTGARLVVFPEGSIDGSPGLRPFHLGAFAAASAAACPVVPVGIRGTRDIVRPGTLLPHRGSAEVFVGAPMTPTSDDFAGHADLGERARQVIAGLTRGPQTS
jgi:1-acyl-sn-glycerol-3-phosphate acyltransferase